jgi:hypothetical protein
MKPPLSIIIRRLSQLKELLTVVDPRGDARIRGKLEESCKSPNKFYRVFGLAKSVVLS